MGRRQTNWREWESGLIWRAMHPGQYSRTERFRRSIRTILVLADPGRNIKNAAGKMWYEASTESLLLEMLEGLTVLASNQIEVQDRFYQAYLG